MSNETVDEYRSQLDFETEAHRHAVEVLRGLEIELHTLEAHYVQVGDDGAAEEREMAMRLVECNRALDESAAEYEEREYKLIRSYDNLESLENMLEAARRAGEDTLQRVEMLEDQEAEEALSSMKWRAEVQVEAQALTEGEERRQDLYLSLIHI